MRRFLIWFIGLLLSLPLLAVLLIAVFGWNWARAPIERAAQERTGRQLVIGGDLHVSLAWPAPRVQAQRVTFANPPWAKEKQMITVDDVAFSVDLPALLQWRLAFPEVHLTRPLVFLERAADGRKTWLLDTDQSDESARIPLGLLTLDQGRLGIDDAMTNTSLRVDISTQNPATQNAAAPNALNALNAQNAQVGNATAGAVTFEAKGTYKGLKLSAHGTGGPVLALRDETVSYPFQAEGTIGPTAIKANGRTNSLLSFSSLDLQLALHGGSLAQLYPLFGLAFPETHPYTVAGHFVHDAKLWRYDKFTGHIGASDLAGSLDVDTAGKRPFMHMALVSQRLEVADLGPLIGAGQPPPVVTISKTAPPPAPVAANTGPHLLPDIPFKTWRWDSVDADVTLRAKTLLRPSALPLEDLNAHLKMQDSQLAVDPLDFGFAGGHLKAVVSLDGRQEPILAHARMSVRKIELAKLFPTFKLASLTRGQLNGEFDLTGKGDTVGHMLATSDGKVSLVVADGEVSKLMMEESGLHLVEILQLKLTGDKTIKIGCAVADFGVRGGVMQTNALLFDTEVNTITGDGSVDLERETLNLRLVPKTKRMSPVALRGPIYLTGTFSRPVVGLDTPRIVARGAGAVALALLNPLLVIAPLVEMGPGPANKCAELVREAQAPPQPAGGLATKSASESAAKAK